MSRFKLLVCLLGFLSLTSQVEAGVLFGATASGSPGDLYTLDPATAAVISHIGSLNDAAGTNYPITGLAFHPTTKVLYGSTGNNPSATAGLLVTINPKTALVTVVGPYNAGPTNTAGVPATMADISFDAAGNLFGVGSIGGPQLYSIDTATAQATVIGSTGLTSTSGGGLAISETGVFSGTPTSSRFGTYDSVTGMFTNITNPVKPGGGGAYAALAYDTAGVLYALNSAPGSPPPAFLATIDPVTGTATAVGQSTVNALDAIAYIPEPSTVALLCSVLLVGVTRRK